MKTRKGVLIGIILLGLVLAPALTQAEEVKVPFSAIKTSCYGEIDISKAEFSLSEVGKGCVVESWLEEHQSELESRKEEQKEKTKKKETKEEPKVKGEKDQLGRTIINKNTKIPNVPLSAIKNSKYSKLETYEAPLTVPAKLCKESWLIRNGYVTEEIKNQVVVPITAIKAEKEDQVDTFKWEVIVPKSWVKEGYFTKKKLEALKIEEHSLAEIVAMLDTPKKVATFMNSHFEPKFHHSWISYSAKEMLEIRKGDCKDWAHFAAYALAQNAYKAKKLSYIDNDKRSNGHIIAVYWDKKGQIYYITTLAEKVKIYGPFNSLEDIIENEIERRPDLNSIFSYSLIEIHELNNYTKLAKKTAKKVLKVTPHIDEVELVNLTLKDSDSPYNMFNNSLIVDFSKDRSEWLIEVNLEATFVNPPYAYLLVPFRTTPNTEYTRYKVWEEKEYPIKEEKIRKGSIGVIFTKTNPAQLPNKSTLTIKKIMVVNL